MTAIAWSGSVVEGGRTDWSIRCPLRPDEFADGGAFARVALKLSNSAVPYPLPGRLIQAQRKVQSRSSGARPPLWARRRGAGLDAGAAMLPFQRMLDDGLQVVELRCPAQQGADAAGIGDDGGGIAGTPAAGGDLEIDARNALDGIDHLEHREAAAVAAIQGQRGAAAAQMPQCVRMRAHQIRHVNVVADAGAVRGLVVGAEDLYHRAH